MAGGRDFYGQWNRPEAFIARLRKDPDISDENKDSILSFIEDLESHGYSAARVRKYISSFRRLVQIAPEGFTFKGATIEDVKAINVAINRLDNEDWTKIGHKTALKAMLKFLDQPDVPPKQRRETALSQGITTTPKKHKRKMPDELISRDELDKLIRACQNERDRAFIAALFESGARIGEFQAVRIKDFDDHGKSATLFLPEGKTGARKIPIVESVGYLRGWLRVHPLAEKNGKGSYKHPDAPLWIKVEKVGKGKDGETPGNVKLNYHAIVSMLRKRADRAGIPRSKVNPHNFRHSRATECGMWMTEAVMCEFFGWIPGSEMPRTYIHLSGRNVNGVVLAHHGLRDEEEEAPESRSCPSCGEKNPGTAKYCNRCQWALDTEAALAQSTYTSELDNQLSDLIKQPGVLEGIVNGAKDKEKVLHILAKIMGNDNGVG